MKYKEIKSKRNKRIICIVVVLSALVLAMASLCVFKYVANKKGNNTADVYGIITEQTTQEPNLENKLEGSAAIQNLIVDSRPQLYTYSDMENDIYSLCGMYPEVVNTVTIGETVDGRKIYDVIVGDKNAPACIMIHAGIHAREYMTCQLVMMQLCDFVRALQNNTEYNGISINELLSDVALHIIPMVNPDGVSISQFGIQGIQNSSTLENIKAIAEADGRSLDDREYLRQWKSNANGVDLNRNFDALWDQYIGTQHPSSDHYKGTFVGSERESAALIDLTQKYNFVRTVSYHTYGQVIYWYFGQSGTLKDITYKFAQDLSSLTGYYTDANYESLDPAGYKDWAISKLSIPSITIEVGTGANPVPYSQLDLIYKQNLNVWYAVLFNYKFG